MRTKLDFKILPQPTETTCGPTYFHAIDRHFQNRVRLPHFLNDIQHLEERGTLAVMLAVMLSRDALKRGHRTKTYSHL